MRAIAVVWLALGVVLSLTQQLALDYLWILSLGPPLAWAATGLILGAVLHINAPNHHAALRHWSVIVAALALYSPLASAGARATAFVRFERNRVAYDRIVDATAVTQPNIPRKDGALEYIVDEGPPVRVAFPWPGGIVDNWCGAVYDPTGEVMQVNEMELWTDDWRTSRVTKLFSGDMTSCRRLDRSYYLCCFT